MTGYVFTMHLPNSLAQRLCLILAIAVGVWPAPQVMTAESTLSSLVGLLSSTDDPQFQSDLLQGILLGLEGSGQTTAPAPWQEQENRLLESSSPEVRKLARTLGLRFGSKRARGLVEGIAIDSQHPAQERRDAITALLSTPDKPLLELLLSLVDSGDVRDAVIRGLALFSDERVAQTLIAHYGAFTLEQKQLTLSTLAQRTSSATHLLSAVGDDIIPVGDLSAMVIRQLSNLESQTVSEGVEAVWGRYRDSNADVVADIRRYRILYRDAGSPPGNANRGRALYARTCQQCHQLFGIGGTAGPDLTGSNRTDLTYLLQNILDPNAVIPNDYQTSVIELKDGRVFTGIVSPSPTTTTILTSSGTHRIANQEVFDLQTSELSLMPEGLLSSLSDQEVRDLLYYLTQPAQVALVADSESVRQFFNGEDLTLWSGNPRLWRVEDGTIIGESKNGLDHNEFLVSELVFEDFRLRFEVRLTPNSENSGVQFRSEPRKTGEVEGYQADIGQDWWGKLYEELGRGLLADISQDHVVRQNRWNHYEILAIGPRIQIALNGHRCVDLTDSAGSPRGQIALQLHSGGAIRVEFRNFEVELSPGSNQLNSVNN